MRLIVLRHGATEWNERGRLQGRADPPLSAAGRRTVMGWSIPEGWHQLPCYVSPLLRACQTADLLKFAEYRIEPALVETDWGDFEGERLADLRARLGPALAENEARGLDFRAPGGESPRDVTKRLSRWLDQLPADQAACLAITHKGVRRAFLAMAMGWDMRAPSPVKLGNDEAMVLHRCAGGGLMLAEIMPLAASS